MICPQCSNENVPGARFCNQCGSPLSADDGIQDNTLQIETASKNTSVAGDAENPPAIDPAENTTEGSEEEPLAFTASADATVDFRKLREELPQAIEKESDEQDAFEGLDQSNYEEMALVTPWEKGATMRMKPIEAQPEQQQRNFVSAEDDVKPKKSKKPLIIALIIVLLGAGVAFGTWYFELWGGIKVPDVVAMSKDSATAVLSDKGFSVRVENVKSDDEEGTVLLTDPEAGARLKEGGEVVIHVATPRVVPSLAGKTKEEAEKALAAEGFTNITFTTEKSNETEGTVLNVTPAADTKLKASYPIQVVVAEPYRVPDVVGKTRDEAIAALEEEGYEVSVTRVYSETDAQGTVLSTSPAANEKLNSGETVTISVAVSRESELVSAVQSAFYSGAQVSVGGISYEISSLSTVSYLGNDTTTVHVTARPYTVFLGVTMYLDPSEYTWTVKWTASNEIASIS